jgi:translation elongation factor EF-G
VQRGPYHSFVEGRWQPAEALLAPAEQPFVLQFLQLAEVDEEIGELFLMEQPVDGPTLQAAVRRATLALQFVPVFVGSAYKNKAGRCAPIAILPLLASLLHIDGLGAAGKAAE